jgi:hypothetical protein
LTFRFYVVIVQGNGYEFHAPKLLLRLLYQQAMRHGSFQAITKRLHSLSLRLHPRKPSGTSVGFLFIPSRSLVTLGQCAIDVPDGVFRCESFHRNLDQDAKPFFRGTNPLLPLVVHERNT